MGTANPAGDGWYRYHRHPVTGKEVKVVVLPADTADALWEFVADVQTALDEGPITKDTLAGIMPPGVKHPGDTIYYNADELHSQLDPYKHGDKGHEYGA